MIGRRHASSLLLCGLPTLAQAQKRASPFETEIIVRTAACLGSPADVVALVDMAARHGVSTINLAVKQDEDDEVDSGLVFYASRIAPRAPAYRSFDLLSIALAEAHRRGIKVRAWMPQFHDQAAVRAHPEWQMKARMDGKIVPYAGRGRTEFFVNPLDPAAQAYQRSLVLEVARDYPVDGIVIDWVRFDDYPMDLGPATRLRYRQISGKDPIDIDFTTDNPERAQWNDFRASEIAAYVKSLRAALNVVKPHLPLGVYILPPAFVEVAQDAARFAADVSFLSPMAYFKDWGFPADWTTRELLPEVAARAGSTAIIPAVDEAWDEDVCRTIFGQIRRTAPEISTLAWFVYGKWTESRFALISRLRTL